MRLRCGPRAIDLTQPVVMGVLNVTPDSFSDGGRWLDREAAIARGLELEQQGAAIIDIGGESTRPGAADVSEEEERRRVVPVIEVLARRTHAVISVDTSRAAVMRAALQAGATLVNDVRALRGADTLQAVASSDAAVCLMHMQGEPRTMQKAPNYTDVIKEVATFLRERVEECTNAGIAAERIAIDPGIGFGKTLEHNLALLANITKLCDLGHPVLVGVSRKSLIGTLTGRGVEERLAGNIAFATAAALAGASIIRAHDVKETLDALRIVAALRSAS